MEEMHSPLERFKLHQVQCTLGRSALGNLKFYNVNFTFQFFSSKNAVWTFLLNGILPQSVAWQRNIKSNTDK